MSFVGRRKKNELYTVKHNSFPLVPIKKQIPQIAINGSGLNSFCDNLNHLSVFIYIYIDKYLWEKRRQIIKNIYIQTLNIRLLLIHITSKCRKQV